MKTYINERLRNEAQRYGLRFACEDCVHFDAERAACGNGWPPSPRRGALDLTEIEFCKELELA
jgi:hypothetical protein